MHRHSAPIIRYGTTTNHHCATVISPPDTIPEWVTKESVDDPIPCARAGHCVASIEDRLFLFGGYCEYNSMDDMPHVASDMQEALMGETLHFNSVHEYAIPTGKWRCLHSGGDPRPRIRVIPGERRHASLVVYGRSLYLYGGFDRSDRVLYDLWQFRIEERKWIPISTLAEPCNYGVCDSVSYTTRVNFPVARAEHTAVVHRNRMIVFGGYDGKKKLNDTFVYDFPTRKWSSPFSARQGAPSRRCKHSAVLYKDRMYILGGFQYKEGDNYALTDMHALDLNTFTWSNFDLNDKAPQALQGHKAVVCGDSMYILGGKVRLRNTRHSLSGSIPSHQSPPAGFIPSMMNGDTPHTVNVAALSQLVNFNMPQSPMRPLPNDTRSSGLNHVVFRYEFGKNRWSVVDTVGIPPTPRQLHATVTVRTSDRRSSIFIFGGTDKAKQKFYNDLLELRGILSPIENPHQPCQTCSSTKTLLDNELFSDVKFLVEDKNIFAHRCILYARSEYFRSMFDSRMRETSASDIPIPDVSYDVFHGVLEYLYSGRVCLNDGIIAVELLKAADMFRIEGLKNVCAEKVEQGVTAENAAFICMVADTHNTSNLKNFCITYIVQNFKDVIKSQSFQDLMRQDPGGLGHEILEAFSDCTPHVSTKRART